jgi:antitoxin component of MazEF toxin-antitoxin module
MANFLDAIVTKYGDSIVVRIPPKEAKRLGIVIGDKVRVHLKRMKLVPMEKEHA